jgi:hypothetical protein
MKGNVQMGAMTPDHGIDRLVGGLMGMRAAQLAYLKLLDKHNEGGIRGREEDRFRYTIRPNPAITLQATRDGFNRFGERVTVIRDVTHKKPFEQATLHHDYKADSGALDFWTFEPADPSEPDYAFVRDAAAQERVAAWSNTDAPLNVTHHWTLSIGVGEFEEDGQPRLVIEQHRGGLLVASYPGGLAVAHAVEPVPSV